MADDGRMARLCDVYVRRVRTIGVLYCVVPTLLWFGAIVLYYPFRSVYGLRLALSLLVGGWLAAVVNRFGLSLWLIKHRSPEGPATVLDGLLIGAAVGVGTVLLPPLTSLISTNHPGEAKTLIICAWLIGLAAGALIGAGLASVGRKHVPTEEQPT